MANNYSFLDAYSSVQTAASSVVAGAHQPIVQISSTITLPVTFSGTPSISGAITIVGTPQVSIVGGSVNLAPTSIATLQGTNPWVIGNSSVMLTQGTNTFGSVATIQGTDPWRVIIPGSVVTVWKSSSILAGLTGTNTSVLTLNTITRNDAVASFLGVDLTTRYMASDSAGRVLIKPFAANEASILGKSSTNNAGDAASVMAVPAAGAGLRNYLTDIMIANTGSVATLITFTEGGASVLGYTIAPATGGSNIIGMNAPIRNQTANQPINIVVGTASSTVYFTVAGHKAP